MDWVTEYRANNDYDKEIVYASRTNEVREPTIVKEHLYRRTCEMKMIDYTDISLPYVYHNFDIATWEIDTEVSSDALNNM